MFFQRSKKRRPVAAGQPQAQILARRSGGFFLHPMEQALFCLKGGRGVLRMARGLPAKPDDPYDVDCYFALMLEKTPLVMIQSSGCPTCEALLGAGWGIPEGHPELRAAADALTAPYEGLEEALDRLRPVTGLLMDGLYILCRSDYFPVDGAGHFFWDQPNMLQTAPATAQLYDSSSFCTLPDYPCFLYPTQPSSRLDENKVDYYRNKIRKGDQIPPALAYVGERGYLSFLLDGHHRACACALEGVNLPCLSIAPVYLVRSARENVLRFFWLDGSSELFLGQEADGLNLYGTLETLRGGTGVLFERAWPQAYKKAAERYPTVREAGALALCPGPLDAQGLEAMLQKDGPRAAASLLEYLARQPGEGCKPLVMEILKQRPCPNELYLAACRILSRMKEDPDAEAFFLDVLVNCEDKSDPLWSLAAAYWD